MRQIASKTKFIRDLKVKIDKTLPNSLFHVSFDPTFKCNLNCVHCYNKGREIGKGKELTTQEIKSIFDQLAELGVLELTISGGEPLLRKDILELYGYAKKKGFLILFFTNATLITPKIADYFKEYPPYELRVSLYGVTKETYEKVTQVAGSFEKFMTGVDLLKNRKIPMYMDTPFITLNKHEFQKIKEYAELVGPYYIHTTLIYAHIIKRFPPAQYYRLPVEEAIEIDMFNKSRRKQLLGLDLTFSDPELIFANPSCRVRAFIDPYGCLTVCSRIPLPSFDIKKIGLHEAVKRLKAFTSMKKTKKTKCISCRISHLCAMCPGISWLEHGDYETPVEYFCREAHAKVDWLDRYKKAV